jgi:Ca-activated chloride channel family protein
MSTRCAIAVTAVLALTSAPLSQLVAQERHPAFRTGVDLVSLSVTVTDAAHRYVADLDRADFLVLENGVPQTLTFFGKAEVPLALALLLDTSASMEGTLATAQEAALGLVRQLGPADQTMVIEFDSSVRTLLGFTNDLGALEAAIRGTEAGGSTALYNALYVALKELAHTSRNTRNRDDQGPRRRAIVVLSDGDDTSSLVAFEEVLELAARVDTVIYTIGLGLARPVGGRQEAPQAPFILRRLAHQTGGRAFFPREVKELAGVYREIRSELSSQYSLAYESSAARNDGRWRPIVVRVNRPGVAARTRQGYYAPKK